MIQRPEGGPAWRLKTFDIMLLDQSTDEVRQITDNSADSMYPSLYADRVVWEDYRDGSAAIYLCNLTTGEEMQITSGAGDARDPAIWGDRIVWAENRTGNFDLYAYDLVCIGFPSYRWSPPKPMDVFLNSKFRQYHAEGRVKAGAPRVPGKNALIFCTYSGPHTGIREAVPAGLYAGQFLEHLGFAVLDEWYVVGEFHGSEEASTNGRLGDIRGRPNEDDLRKVQRDIARLLSTLRATT